MVSGNNVIIALCVGSITVYLHECEREFLISATCTNVKVSVLNTSNK